MKKINYLLTLVAVIVLQSCVNDMDVVSTDPTVKTPDELFSSVQGYTNALGGVYGNLSLTGTGDAGSSFLEGIDAGTSQFGRCWWYLQELTTDEAIWSYENDEGVRELQRNIWSSSNPLFLGMFGRTMAEIAFANDFLRESTTDKLNSRGITSAADVATIQLYRQEVRALRAYAYYVMMDLFGKAPFYDENTPLSTPGPQYTRQQLFNYIESELNAVLPDLKAPRTNQYGRLDKAFAWMVLSKMYLNAEVYIGTPKYTECMAQCTNLLGSSYALKTNYLDNFKADNHTSSELIFTLQSDGLVTQNYGATTVIINGEVGSLEGNGAELGVGGWGGALRLRKQFVQKFDGLSSDARNTIYAGSRPIDISNVSTQGQGYIIKKFSNKTAAGVAGPNSTFVDTDFPLFRLADAYLMYAEAQMRKDGATNTNNIANATTQSVQYINDLRVRANSPQVSQGDVKLSFIIDERARELHWEGHRRQDLIRFGKYVGGNYNWAWKGNSINGTALLDKYKMFPIPANSLQSNPNLTQNPGY